MRKGLLTQHSEEKGKNMWKKMLVTKVCVCSIHFVLKKKTTNPLKVSLFFKQLYNFRLAFTQFG